MKLLIASQEGQAFELWPVTALPSHLIYENGSYRVTLADIPDSQALAGCHLILGDVDHGAGRLESRDELTWLWLPQDYAGRIRLQLETSDGTQLIPHTECVIDPHRHKLTRQQFERMIADINREATIAYSLSPATQDVALQQQWDHLDLSQLEYLMQRLVALRRVVEAIAERPRRRLQRMERDLPFVAAPAADSGSLIRLLHEPDTLMPVATAEMPACVQTMARNLNDMLPTQLRVRHHRVSHDVYENQLIKHFLQRLGRALRRTTRSLGTAAQNYLLDPDIRNLAQRRLSILPSHERIIHSLLQFDLFREVSSLRAKKPVTPTLRKDPLYARFYALYREFSRAITPFDGAPFQLSLEKTWQLYEYWCFFQTVGALRELCQGSLNFDARQVLQPHVDGVSLSLSSVEIRVSDRVSVSFQKSYRYYGWSDAQPPGRIGTYSHEMRPDISIEVRDERGAIEEIILLDPKYRASYSSINQALDDLHRYKDAIVSPNRTRLVRTALVLCPTDAQAKSIYFDPSYVRAHGLGVIALAPTTTPERSTLVSVLAELLDDHLGISMRS